MEEKPTRKTFCSDLIDIRDLPEKQEEKIGSGNI